MICKRVKSKPYHIAYIALHDLQDEIYVIADEAYQLVMKDISLMSRDATFSQPLGVLPAFYVQQEITKIQEIPVPEDEVKTAGFEELNFDL